jgi:hypothetical protein
MNRHVVRAMLATLALAAALASGVPSAAAQSGSGVPPISRRVGYLAPVGEARVPEAALV